MSTRIIISLIMLCTVAIIHGCGKNPVSGPVIPYVPDPVYRVSEDDNASCSNDEYPFFSCHLDASLPFYQAETVKDKVEMTFCMADGKPSVINPAYRSLFNLIAYEDALFTSYMLTGISSADFDTIQTDYLIHNYTPGDYYINLTSHMNCIFFRSANSNYGLIRINSISGFGTGINPLNVNFDVKYVDLAE